MKKSLLTGVCGCGLALLVGGCSNFGATDPVLSGSDNGYKPRLVANQPVAQERSEFNDYAPREVASPRSNKELASLTADLDSLREEQKLLMARIVGLEQDNIRKDAQIKELQSLLAEMDKRSADVDQAWRNRMAELSTTIDKERVARRHELETFTKVITKELDKNNAPAEPAVEYKVLQVQNGESLGKIARAAGCTVEELKRINNLKSDTIYVNQKLKVPVKR